MNEFVAGVLRLVLRVVVVAMGVVLFLSLVAAVMVLALVWALRAQRRTRLERAALLGDDENRAAFLVADAKFLGHALGADERNERAEKKGAG